ncbi:reverse transcriptase domain-containing protein [Tanacetum coccineum]
MGTPTQVCVWSCPNFSAPAGRPFRCVSDIWLLISGDAKRFGTSLEVVRDNAAKDEDSKCWPACCQIIRRGERMYRLVEVEGVEDLGKVSNRGNVGNQNGNVVNENVQENVGNVIVNGNRIEKMESVHVMSGCSVDQKVKYTTGLFMGKALTWWNSQICTLSREVVVSMSWNDFKFMMLQEFCPSHEMQKLESELWNHAMVGAGHAAYTDRFHELARLVPHLVTPESRMIERYAYGLAPQIHGMVVATNPKTIQKAMKISGVLTDEDVRNGSIKKVKKRGNIGGTACLRIEWLDCPRLNRAQGPEENRPNQVAANNGGQWKRIFTKGRKTKPKTTKPSTEWKSVKRRSQIEAKKSTKSTSQQKSQTVKVKVNPNKVKSTPRSWIRKEYNLRD